MAIRRAYRSYRRGSWGRAYRPGYYGRGWGWRGYRRRWPWMYGPSAAPIGPVPSAGVAWAQQALAQIFGPVVPQDGILGPETRGFVARFQGQQGLPPTGDLDDATMAALQAVTAGPAVPSPLAEAPPPPIFGGPPPLPPGPPEIIPGPPWHHHHEHPLPPGPPMIIPGPPRHHRGDHPPRMGLPPGPPGIIAAPPGQLRGEHPMPPGPPPGPPGVVAAPPGQHRGERPMPPGVGEVGELSGGPATPQESSARGRWIRRGERIILMGA
jgi:hypothetical protein